MNTVNSNEMVGKIIFHEVKVIGESG